MRQTLAKGRNAAPEDAFTLLAKEHRDGVYRQMVRLCGNREDAEDVLIDALLSAYRHMESLRERALFGAWLAQIARRLCFRLKSQQKIRAALSLDALDEQGWQPMDDVAPSPEEQAIREQMRHALRSAMDALPAELRAVYVLRDLEERSGEETAAQLGLSLAAMKSRLHRARALVRERLDAALRAGQQGAAK